LRNVHWQQCCVSDVERRAECRSELLVANGSSTTWCSHSAVLRLCIYSLSLKAFRVFELGYCLDDRCEH
jgi:hypothetical protein